VRAGPLELALEAEGTLKSATATPLQVPGEQWSRRQLLWMKPDGSRVEAGEVVARFGAAEGELELEKALLDLQRNALARLGKASELDAMQGRVDVDLAQVATELAIATRYADADLAMFARNQILDAIQDRRFLASKQGVLAWQREKASERGGAEIAVLDSQKASFALNAERRRKDLDALELVAPHAGVLVLSADWSNEKPRVGASLWAGNEFASLPDPAALEVELVLPQLEAQGLAPGQTVEVHPAGKPEQALRSTLSWVASAPQQRGGRGNPVKFIAMKASVPAEVAQRHGWVPGQAFRGRIVLHAAAAAISVPNVALIADGERRFVELEGADGPQRREVKLGVRGPARSEVREGLAEGERVRLLPGRAGSAEART
jgi:HlyD family secretion protein